MSSMWLRCLPAHLRPTKRGLHSVSYRVADARGRRAFTHRGMGVAGNGR